MADMEADPKSGPSDRGSTLASGGPGRKPKACVECRKLKMKCETFPGDRKCRHCLRRQVDCVVTRRSEYSSRTDLSEPSEGQMDRIKSYEQKIDAMRSEIHQMRQSLNAVLQKTHHAHINEPTTNQTDEIVPEAPKTDVLEDQEEQQAAQALLSVNKLQGVATATSGSTTSPAVLSGREDNMQMAMTRENSLEPQSSSDQGNGPVTVEDPMGSLYEVTRLRNIRSNKSKTSRPLADNQGELNDFISRGVVPEAEAKELYDMFHTSLNHYLWVGLEQTHPSFDSVRKSSELLTATILTVTALHIPTSAATFDACYKEFLSLISSSMFSRYHSIDDVRGLCIAAFWLSEVSWKLSGHAIRIATELNIHQSFSRALEGDKEHFLRARLWYMLYVCDHHFSIAYGRPPMIGESTQIREHELFLQSPHADALDARILSQVSLMQIMTRIYERFAEKMTLSTSQADVRSSQSTKPVNFTPEVRSETAASNLATGSGVGASHAGSDIDLLQGTNPERGSQTWSSPHGSLSSAAYAPAHLVFASSGNGSHTAHRSNATNGSTSPTRSDSASAMLTDADFDALRGLNLEIDQWRMVWYTRQTTNYFIGTFPPKGIVLYSYFAKLQLNSLAVRGVSLSSSTSPGGRLSTQRKEFANIAISAAASILTFVLEEDDMRRALVGTPLYVHTMIAFASVFLMKVATKWNRVMGLNVEEGYVSKLLGRMISVLKSAVTSDRHVLKHIAAGLEKMLQRMNDSRERRETETDEFISDMEARQRQSTDTAQHAQPSHHGHDAADGMQYNGLSGTTGFAAGYVHPGAGSTLRIPMMTPASWDSASTYTGNQGDNPDGGMYGTGMGDMHDNLIYEAFGTGSANDVYNLLSTQLSSNIGYPSTGSDFF